MKSILRSISVFLLGFFFLGTGLLHFINPQPFVDIVPNYLPSPLLLVQISGVFEILGGIGLMVPKTRRFAGWGLIALLIAVFPANIYMLTSHPYLAGNRVPEWTLWLRLPFQFILMGWIWWIIRPATDRKHA